MSSPPKLSTRLIDEKQRLVRRREYLLRAFISATEQRERLRMSHLSKRLTDVTDGLDALVQIEKDLAASRRPDTYLSAARNNFKGAGSTDQMRAYTYSAGSSVPICTY